MPRLQRSTALKTSQAVEGWASFCLGLISPGIWQNHVTQICSSKAFGKLSQGLSCLPGSSSEENIPFCSCWGLRNSSHFPSPCFPLSPDKNHGLSLCCSCRAPRLMILSHKWSKRETLPKHQGMWALTVILSPGRPWTGKTLSNAQNTGKRGFHALNLAAVALPCRIRT